MAKLTDGPRGTIARMAAPAKGQRLIFDDHRDAPRGFGLRVTAAGGKAFILKYTVDGRERRATIGPWPTWTLEAARAEAHEMLRGIGKGQDPLDERHRRREEPTVAELAAEWLEKYASGLASEKDVRRYVEKDLLPAIGYRKVSDVRRRHIIEVVEAKAVTAPRAASHLLSYARQLFDFAADRDFLPLNPLAGLRPSSITAPGKKSPLKAVRRARILDHQEIYDFWNKVESCGLHKLTALALKLVLVTGQRPGEVAGMHENEIDGLWWTIAASRRGKTENENRVFLTGTAMAIIDAARAEVARLQKRRKEPAVGFIFEARPGSGLDNNSLCRAVARKHEQLGAKEDPQWGRWTPHDLRRTMRTGLSAARIRPDIAELVIGHGKRGVVAIYDQYGFDAERRHAAEAWERRLLEIVAGRDPDAADTEEKVVRLEALA